MTELQYQKYDELYKRKTELVRFKGALQKYSIDEYYLRMSKSIYTQDSIAFMNLSETIKDALIRYIDLELEAIDNEMENL